MSSHGKAGPLPELGVIGWPLQLTFSPPMQIAALRKAALDWRYEAMPVSPEELTGFISNAAATMRGFNVTIPHKSAVRIACSVVDDLASRCDAVNTVVCVRSQGRNRLEGHNTDGPGLLKALSLRTGFEPSGSSVLVLGAGGAAAGAAAALARCGSSTITIANRTEPRAAILVDKMRAMFPKTTWLCAALNEEAPCRPEACCARHHIDLVINCMPEEPSARLGRLLEAVCTNGPAFCDMSYSYGPTALLDVASDIGYRVVPGLEMLLWQGVYAFEIFTRRPAVVDAMRDALTAVAGEWWLKC
ncbi:MAG: shikimate dehydrogenase [Firmicutes bacterium]|nr:shikimate dehydrogenase [Bacillota bacterium]